VIVKLVLFLAQVYQSIIFLKFFYKFDFLGINACYIENLDNVPKWAGIRNETTKQIVINTEWGAFGKVSYLNLIKLFIKILF
jgi:hypothetical protein